MLGTDLPLFRSIILVKVTTSKQDNTGFAKTILILLLTIFEWNKIAVTGLETFRKPHAELRKVTFGVFNGHHYKMIGVTKACNMITSVSITIKIAHRIDLLAKWDSTNFLLLILDLVQDQKW